MKKIRVGFIGVGSIARRHIKNLKNIEKELNIDIIIDVVRRTNVIDSDEVFKHIENIYTSVDDLANNIYDAIFITNPTEFHLDTLSKVEKYSSHFFIEKPVVSVNQINNIEKYEFKTDSIYYVASPLKFCSVIQYIKQNINLDEVISIRCISSSYLPEWRTNTDYRETYSAKKELGGGVSIDLIHEWDYLIYLFGTPKEIKCFMGKKSDLEITSDDYAIYIAEYYDKILELHLDYFGRKSIRKLELITKEDTIIADIINNEIKFLKSEKTIVFDEKRDDYQVKELKYFLSLIDKNDVRNSNVKQAIKTLKVTQGEI